MHLPETPLATTNMDVGRFRDKAMKLLSEAYILDNRGSYTEAILKYGQGLEHLLVYIRCEGSRTMHPTVHIHIIGSHCFDVFEMPQMASCLPILFDQPRGVTPRDWGASNPLLWTVDVSTIVISLVGVAWAILSPFCLSSCSDGKRQPSMCS